MTVSLASCRPGLSSHPPKKKHGRGAPWDVVLALLSSENTVNTIAGGLDLQATLPLEKKHGETWPKKEEEKTRPPKRPEAACGPQVALKQSDGRMSTSKVKR